jgi:hypothetical protein
MLLPSSLTVPVKRCRNSQGVKGALCRRHEISGGGLTAAERARRERVP